MTRIKNKTTHSLPVWTEVNYGALCTNPYLSTPVFVPGETGIFLCREDGSRKEMRLTFTVFKSLDSDEWEDDPMIGNILMEALGDADEEVEPVQIVNLGVSPDKFISVVREDANDIVFNISWEYGDVEIKHAQITNEGYLIHKSDFGDDGIECKLSPHFENSFTINIQIPVTGFSLHDAEDNLIHGNLETSPSNADKYTYSFISDGSNDRFSIVLEEGKLNYLCVLREDGSIAIRNQRDHLSLVGNIPAEGTLSQLLMGTHDMLVKNKNSRWHVTIAATISDNSEEEFNCSPSSLIEYAYGKFTSTPESEQGNMANDLLLLERKYFFQWFWLDKTAWEEKDDNEFNIFMLQLTALSYLAQKPIQGDQLQARNDKRKITRCAKRLAAYKKGEENIWSLSEEERQENLHFFLTYHREFLQILDSLLCA